MPLDLSGQLDGQLVQIGDVKKGITVPDTVVSHYMLIIRAFCPSKTDKSGATWSAQQR